MQKSNIRFEDWICFSLYLIFFFVWTFIHIWFFVFKIYISLLDLLFPIWVFFVRYFLDFCLHLIESLVLFCFQNLRFEPLKFSQFHFTPDDFFFWFFLFLFMSLFTLLYFVLFVTHMLWNLLIKPEVNTTNNHV